MCKGFFPEINLCLLTKMISIDEKLNIFFKNCNHAMYMIYRISFAGGGGTNVYYKKQEFLVFSFAILNLLTQGHIVKIHPHFF